jgi:hypothetical protein
MKKNMSSMDGIVRIALAVVFAILYFTDIVTGTLGIVLLVVGIVFLLTAMLNYCPIYGILGLSTRKKEKA